MMKRFACMILVFCGVCQGLRIDEVCPRRHHALLIALLPLHGGFDCRQWVQKGVQQRVALEAAVEDVNTDNELQIGLQVLDTCSSKEKAAESATRAVAFAEKRCSKFPVFLGHLGPDDEESLRAIFGIYKYPHVVPATERSFQHSAINIDVINSNERARRISTFLKYLNWHSFIMIFTSDTISSRIATSLLQSDDFCLTNSFLQIPSFGSGKKNRAGFNKLRKAVEGVQNVRIVILTDDSDVMEHFTDYVEEEWGGFEYVVYTQTSGFLPWRWSTRMSRNTIILHEVPKSPLVLPDLEDTVRNSTLWLSYTKQIRNACEGCQPGKFVLDTTVIPYVYSIHLFSRALRTAIKKKCDQALICDSLKNMSPYEWKAILKNTAVVINSHKIGFYMELDSQIDIILPGENNTDNIGYIERDLIIHRPRVLKQLNRTRAKQCLVDMYEYELEQDENDATTPQTYEKTEETAADEEKIQLNFGYNELMATVIGFPIGLAILIALIIFCVCRSLQGISDNPKKSNLSTGSGVEDYS